MSSAYLASGPVRRLATITSRHSILRSAGQPPVSSARIARVISTKANRSLINPSSAVPISRTLPNRSIPSGKRSFFSLPDIRKLAGLNEVQKTETGEVRTEGDQQTFHARKILPYSAAQLYNIVSDVPSYSAFIPFCTSSTVLSSPSSNSAGAPSRGSRRPVETTWKPTDQPFDVEAELKVGFGGLEEAYVSKVTGRPFESVRAEAVEEAALFKSLVTTWSFSPASDLSPHPSTPPSSHPAPPQNPRVPNDTSDLGADTSRGPTLLTIDLAFEFSNPLHRIASQAVLPKVADKMVRAFEERCVDVYGKA